MTKKSKIKERLENRFRKELSNPRLRSKHSKEDIRVVPSQLHGWWDDLVDTLELE